MSNHHVYKKVEVVGSSPNSIDDAKLFGTYNGAEKHLVVICLRAHSADDFLII